MQKTNKRFPLHYQGIDGRTHRVTVCAEALELLEGLFGDPDRWVQAQYDETPQTARSKTDARQFGRRFRNGLLFELAARQCNDL
ncbi:hypothetical protein [Thauera sp. 63]|jgi:hypothetical protein|uniref:hypothetical protein n=1 Tax=Thauera sp. 63 TaxID=497321 RepID=UPI0002D00BE4|nr:hypothetical protein [Thauera sp. 63]ENO78335.1 hypothetical protein C664_08298 [Thauera sp. 63]